MATPVNCPNCGSTLAPSVAFCARCGHKLGEEPTGTTASGQPLPRPATVPPPPPAAASIDIRTIVNDVCERWGVSQTSYLAATAALAGLALVIGTIAHISYLTAGSAAFAKHLHNAVWLALSIGFAFAAAALAVLVRRASGTQPAATAQNPDLRVAAGLAGLALLFALVGMIIGMGGRGLAADSWERYAQLFAFLALAWVVLSRPVPAELGTTSTATIGLIALAGGVGALVIGQIMGLSNSNDSYVGGVSWQAAGIVLVTLVLGWFLGMRPKGE
jgi:hypothetical protein